MYAPGKTEWFYDPASDETFLQPAADIAYVVKRKRLRHSYHPLEPGYIRLLVLHPGEYDDALQVTLMKAKLSDAPKKIKYDALSYVWGDDPAIHPICIFDESKGPNPDLSALPPKERWAPVLDRSISIISARANLVLALKRLRQKPPRGPKGHINFKLLLNPRYIRILWVDALCINQRDIEEKSMQLRRMNEIYNRAQNVIIWFGETKDNSDVSMDFIDELVTDDSVDDVVTTRVDKKKVTAFLNLIKNRWFGRRWIIQEIFFGTNPIIYFGKKKNRWENFIVALSRIMDLLEEPSLINEIEGLRDQAPETLGAYGANILKTLYTELLEKDPHGRLKPRQTLDYLVSRLTAFDAGDPRDIVYAVRSLAHEPRDHQLSPPDYKSSVLDVFADFIEYSILLTGQLDIICRPWAPASAWVKINLSKHEQRRVDSALPSWIRQLDTAQFGTPEEIFAGRIHGECLAGITAAVYDASDTQNRKHKPAQVKLRKHLEPRIIMSDEKVGSQSVVLKEVYSGILEVSGFVLGTVWKTSDRMIPEIIPRDVVALAGWKFSHDQAKREFDDVPAALWKTLIAGRHLDGESAEFSDQNACLKMLLKRDRQGDIHLRKLLKDPKFIGKNKTLRQYIERARVVCWNRRALRVKRVHGGREEEQFGIGPETMQRGDLACIIFGCSTPVILRETSNPPPLGFTLQPFSKDGRSIAPPTPRDIGGRSPLPQESAPTSAGASIAPSAATSVAPSVAASVDEFASLPSVAGEEELFYEVIGECYIDGVMDGQAMHDESNLSREQMFALV
jgi:hypothetical protein